MIGPALPRSFGFARRRVRSSPGVLRRPARTSPAELHPTTLRALSVMARLMGMLKEHGMEPRGRPAPGRQAPAGGRTERHPGDAAGAAPPARGAARGRLRPADLPG